MRCGALALASVSTKMGAEEERDVNDVHSQLNRTCVARIVRPQSLEQLREAILQAGR